MKLLKRAKRIWTHQNNIFRWTLGILIFLTVATYVFLIFSIVRFYGDVALDEYGELGLITARPIEAGTEGPSVNSARCLSDINGTIVPRCIEKINWLVSNADTHDCYAKFGVVKGDPCTARIYLSEVERFCPSLPGRLRDVSQIKQAEPNLNLEALLSTFRGKVSGLAYMRDRLTTLWTNWRETVIFAQQHETWFRKRTRRKVIVHLGFLHNTNLGEFSSRGGPLGELLQWSDLIAAIHVLGHELLISADQRSFNRLIKTLPDQPCPHKGGVDIIFTDIMGIAHMRRNKSFYLQNRCRLRVLDSFGTQAPFNSKRSFEQLKKDLPPPINTKRRHLNPWGGHQLDLKQFYTFFPHSHDNTFLGFVIPPLVGRKEIREKNAVLVYGKESYMWEKHNRTIQVASRVAEVHATVGDSLQTLPFVRNHGLLNVSAVHNLLRSMNAFMGLGFPLEGPAPLEAIANGVAFINARFSQSKSRTNFLFLSEKPTLRQMLSQNDYAYRIGPPWVYTLNIEDESALLEALEKAVVNPPEPFVPTELSFAGYLKRVAVLIEKQQFCYDFSWPPRHAMKVVLGDVRASCEEACISQKLRCHPSFFPILNANLTVSMPSVNGGWESSNSFTAPFIDVTGKHFQQTDASAFGCAHSYPERSERRICPCIATLPEDSELCQECVPL